MNAWSPLPNAPLIDWVLESLRTDPEKWRASYDATNYMTCTTTWDEAWDAARDATRTDAWDAARNAARHAARHPALESAWAVAYDTIYVLIACDDCDEYLSMSYEKLLAWALLSEKPQAVLLLPLKWMREREAIEA